MRLYMVTIEETIYWHEQSKILAQSWWQLAFDGDGLHLEVTTTEEGTCTDESAGWVVFGEIGLIDGIELIEQGEVRAKHLNVDEVVHGHASLGKSTLHAVHHKFDFLVEFGGRLAGLGVEADAPGKIERVANHNAVAEGRLHSLLRGVVDLAPELGGGLREDTMSGEKAGNEQGNERESGSAVHESLLKMHAEFTLRLPPWARRDHDREISPRRRSGWSERGRGKWNQR